MITVKKIKLFPDHFFNQEITLQGWVQNNRSSKNISFLVVTDGSSLSGIQVIYKKDLVNFTEISKLLPGSALSIQGKLVKAYNPQEVIELSAHQISVINCTQSDYFLQTKKHSSEFLRTKSELRARSKFFYAIFKVRSILSKAIHEFLEQQGFIYLNSPIITNNDCEGAGEGFNINDMTIIDNQKKSFFNKTATLSVSGQLHAEAFAQSYKKVYTFGPTFRADKSNTRVHSSEFWMVEPEIAFADQKAGISLVTQMIKGILQIVFVQGQSELNFLSEFYRVDLLKRIEELVHLHFIELSYSQAIEILQKNQDKFKIKSISWGQDLNKEHELFLCSYFQSKPVFIIDYPKQIKAFYMKQNDDQKTVACFDLLFPKLGEVVGGSERENDYHKLFHSIQEKQIPFQNIEWYLNLRLQGYAGSTGFGLGFDRLLMYITGVENIRDVIPFFNGYQTLNF